MMDGEPAAVTKKYAIYANHMSRKKYQAGAKLLAEARANLTRQIIEWQR